MTPEMIHVAQAKNLSNTEFVVGDSENLPLQPGGQTKKDVLPCGNTSFYCLPKYQAQSAYSWGPAETRALPCSLPSYFLKFLMKRLARSLAFSSHWEASA